MSAAAGFTDLLDDLDGWLARAAKLFPAVARDEARIKEQSRQLRTRGARLEAPLVILLAGGTGAGKSTLMNALAGAEIAQASAVRPTTTALTCYVHAEDELHVPAELGLARKVLHERPELEQKLVIDTPDFDSTSREHEQVLRRALAVADLVVVLATPEKYANRALFELLVEHRSGKAFVFAMNRADRGIEPEVLLDFRHVLEAAGFEEPRLLPVSALAAFRRKMQARGASAIAEGAPPPREETGRKRRSGKLAAQPQAAPSSGAVALAPSEPMDEGEFAALEAIIERELDRARIREIKRQNLESLTARLLERAARPMPQDLEERLRRWRSAGERILDEVRRDVAGRLAERVREDAALRHEIAARLALRHDGIFGLWQALAWGVRGLRGEGLSGLARRRAILDPLLGGGGAPAASGALASSEPDEDEERAAGAQVALATRRIADLGGEHGLAVPSLAATPEEGTRLVAAARHDADRAIDAVLASLHPGAGGKARRRAAPGFSAAAEARGGPRGDAGRSAGLRLASALLNLGPLLVLAYALYSWFDAFFRRGVALDSSWFIAAGIVCVIILVLEGKLVDWIARRRAGAVVRRLEEAAGAAADQRVARPLAQRLERALGEIESTAASLDAIRDAANAAAGGAAR